MSILVKQKIEQQASEHRSLPLFCLDSSRVFRFVVGLSLCRSFALRLRVEIKVSAEPTPSRYEKERYTFRRYHTRPAGRRMLVEANTRFRNLNYGDPLRAVVRHAKQLFLFFPPKRFSIDLEGVARAFRLRWQKWSFRRLGGKESVSTTPVETAVLVFHGGAGEGGSDASRAPLPLSSFDHYSNENMMSVISLTDSRYYGVTSAGCAAGFHDAAFHL